MDEDWNLTTLEGTTYHSAYHPLYEIDRFMRELEELHPGLVKVNNIGHSGMGREMLSLTISKEGKAATRQGRKKEKPSNDGVKLAFVITGAQHAREVRLL